MRDLVTQGKRDFRLRTKTGDVIRSCPNKDYLCFAQAVHQFCTHEVKYVFDPNGVELIEAPYKILESRIADCDSIVVLAAAMLESIGLPARFVTIKADPVRSSEWSHVFLQVKVPRNGWIDMDCTMPDKPFGWGPPAYYERKTWPASNDKGESHDTDEMAGMGTPMRDNVPHTEFGQGVVVGSDWTFRDEAALITATPEALELAPFKTKSVDPSPSPVQQDFFFKRDIEAELARESAKEVSDSGPVTMSATQSAGGSFSPWWLAAGAVALLFLWGKGRR
jgi:hypothetical protein